MARSVKEVMINGKRLNALFDTGLRGKFAQLRATSIYKERLI